MPHVEIRPGTVAQVMATKAGKKVMVTDDVQGVANALLEVSDELRLVYDTEQALWIVEQHTPMPDGSIRESLVTTALDLDHRIVAVCREVCSPGYDLAAEIDKSEAKAQADQEHARREAVGEHAERLAHALKKDLSRHEIPKTLKSRAFIPPFRPRD